MYQTTWGAATPATYQGPGSQVQVAHRLTVLANGWIVGMRFCRNREDDWDHLALLRDGTSMAILRVALFHQKAAVLPQALDGWQHVYFRPRLRVVAGQLIVFCLYSMGGMFYFTDGGLAADVVVGDLKLTRDVAAAHNGLYIYNSLYPPNGTFHSNRYGIDVLFLKETP